MKSSTPLGGALSLLVVLGLWAFWFEPAGIRIEFETIELGRLSASCGELKVAVVSDLHVGSPRNGLAKVSRVVELTNQAEPDLILLLGDFVTQGVLGGEFVDPSAIAQLLTELEAPLGVFAVLGNHDWWFDGPRVAAALQDHDIPLLEDTASTLPIPSCDLWVVGISDFWESDHDVAAALALVPDSASVIAFTHNPDVFPDVPSRVALTLAGHTHGGQVRLPFVGAPVIPSDFGQLYAGGVVREQDRVLFVSTGVGTSILPVRFRVPPTVSLLTLRHAPTP